jgi:hypothetical protein
VKSAQLSHLTLIGGQASTTRMVIRRVTFRQFSVAQRGYTRKIITPPLAADIGVID